LGEDDKSVTFFGTRVEEKYHYFIENGAKAPALFVPLIF
jgi:hypothetical protein